MSYDPKQMKVHELFVNEMINNPDFKSACTEYAASRNHIMRFRCKMTPPVVEADNAI